MELDLPFKVEYCKLNDKTETCAKCQQGFTVNALRVAEMVKSELHDGRDPQWLHILCFTQNPLARAPDEFQDLERLKYSDQVKILSAVEAVVYGTISKKIDSGEWEDSDETDYQIEYSLSDDSRCYDCKNPICFYEIRITKIVRETNLARRFGKEIWSFHLDCFASKRCTYGFKKSGDLLPGFDALEPTHRSIVRAFMPSIGTAEEPCEPPTKKLMSSFWTIYADKEKLEKKISTQTAELFRIRSALETFFSEETWKIFLEANKSDVVGDNDDILDRCADFIAFGAICKCWKCSEGDMIFSKHGYSCNGLKGGWIPCGNFEETPPRFKCVIPEFLKSDEFLSTCSLTIEDRIVRPRSRIVQNTIQTAKIRIIPPLQDNKKLQNIRVINGTAVDPKSRLNLTHQVYEKEGVYYTVVLGLADVERNKNSYYKLQVIASAVAGMRYYLFESRGRIGTEIGESKVLDFATAAEACARFKNLYKEQTGNQWQSTESFKRFPGKLYPIDVNYGFHIPTYSSVASKLNHEITELLKLLVSSMSVALKEINLDTEKMPLGKISFRQLLAAVAALDEIEVLLRSGNGTRLEYIGLSNKFYTLLPRNFGVESLPVIDSFYMVCPAREMVEALIEILGPYVMMLKAGEHEEVNTFDAYYAQMGVKIESLDLESTEYGLIRDYANKERDPDVDGCVRHTNFEILGIFKVERFGEKERFEEFKSLHNRQLLWHGSPVSNFASILSSGLKMANVARGGMFGRGIYFADSICKSINYCGTDRLGVTHRSIALLLLSEVALGDMHEVIKATQLTSAPDGNHSVKALGQVYPNPSGTYTREDGVIIPMGRSTMSLILPSDLRRVYFNEYIVYNEAQVNMQYLVKVRVT